MVGKRPVSGFTIVELMIVIVIIGLLAGLVISTFVQAQKNARNAQITSLAKAYYNAIEAYIADNGAYPPDWACLGTGYPDINSDGTAADCDGDTTTAWIRENSAFNTAIQPYIGAVKNRGSAPVITTSWGGRGVGASYNYLVDATLNGTPQNRWLVYYLEGQNAKCSVGPNTKLDTWPAFSYGSWGGSSENWWDNGVKCWVPLTQLN